MDKKTKNRIIKAIMDGKVYARIEKVSQSGMSRTMAFYLPNKNGIETITDEIAELGGYRTNKDGYLSVTGCGMDMIFSVLYNAVGKKRDVWGQQYKRLY